MRALMQYTGLGLPPERTPEPPRRDSKLEEALQQYNRYCADAAKKRSSWCSLNFYYLARDYITTVLNQVEKNLFLEEIADGTEDPIIKGTAVTEIGRAHV